MDRVELAADRSELRALVESTRSRQIDGIVKALAGGLTEDGGTRDRGRTGSSLGRQAIAAVLDHLDANYPQDHALRGQSRS